MRQPIPSATLLLADTLDAEIARARAIESAVLGLAQCPDERMIDGVHRLCTEHVQRLGAISEQLDALRKDGAGCGPKATLARISTL